MIPMRRSIADKCKWCDGPLYPDAIICPRCSGCQLFASPPFYYSINQQTIGPRGPNLEQINLLDHKTAHDWMQVKLLQYQYFLRSEHLPRCSINEYIDFESTARSKNRVDFEGACDCGLYDILSELEKAIEHKVR
jgi:hypothetical protein